MRIVPPLFSIAQLLLELCICEVCLFYAVEVRRREERWETQTVTLSRFGKKRWLGDGSYISPSILHLTTKVIGAIESSDQELHNGATKFSLRLNIY